MTIDCVIKNVTSFDGLHLQKNKTVLISKNKILDVIDSKQYKNTIQNQYLIEIDGDDNILAPGFIDIQVNGGGGAFFN